MAAIMAARKGAAVTVLEQNEKPGKKICATGNGRCNFSNLAKPDDAYRGEHPEFAEGALVQFSVEDTIDFFREIHFYNNLKCSTSRFRVKDQRRKYKKYPTLQFPLFVLN